MIKDPRLSTIDSPNRYGGLLICGLNNGLGRGANPTEELEFHPPWAQYFTHQSSRKGDRFVSGLTRWFKWWNIPLKKPPGTPTELNLSISRTNLFYDTTKSFVDRSQSEVDFAFSRLQSAIKQLNASGVLLTSTNTKLVSEAARRFNVSTWQDSASGSFLFKHSRTGHLHIAVCPHPRIPQYQSDVESVTDTVTEWIENVMREYAKKQRYRSENANA